jgi:hypothetical protein
VKIGSGDKKDGRKYSSKTAFEGLDETYPA